MSQASLDIPRRILLATDLTPRCDRALDRAVQLAEEFQAELIAAYIMAPTDTPQDYLDRSRRSWGRIPDPLERMGWRLRQIRTTRAPCCFAPPFYKLRHPRRHFIPGESLGATGNPSLGERNGDDTPMPHQGDADDFTATQPTSHG